MTWGRSSRCRSGGHSGSGRRRRDPSPARPMASRSPVLGSGIGRTRKLPAVVTWFAVKQQRSSVASPPCTSKARQTTVGAKVRSSVSAWHAGFEKHTSDPTYCADIIFNAAPPAPRPEDPQGLAAIYRNSLGVRRRSVGFYPEADVSSDVAHVARLNARFRSCPFRFEPGVRLDL
jgi:hypothetical protein